MHMPETLKSRKFYALITALINLGIGYATKEISATVFFSAVTAALMGYALGIAVEDAGAKSALTKTVVLPVPVETKTVTVVEKEIHVEA